MELLNPALILKLVRINLSASKFRASMGNYIPLLYLNVMSYPFPNPKADLANRC